MDEREGRSSRWKPCGRCGCFAGRADRDGSCAVRCRDATYDRNGDYRAEDGRLPRSTRKGYSMAFDVPGAGVVARTAFRARGFTFPARRSGPSTAVIDPRQAIRGAGRSRLISDRSQVARALRVGRTARRPPRTGRFKPRASASRAKSTAMFMTTRPWEGRDERIHSETGHWSCFWPALTGDQPSLPHA